MDIIKEESVHDYTEGNPRRSQLRYGDPGSKTPFSKHDYGVPRRGDHRKANCQWGADDQKKNRFN
jgi:hypothetical protein